MVTIDSVMRGLKKSLPERHHKLIPLNRQAISAGMELVKEVENIKDLA
jgi:2-oxoglutarate ferredoxin oxidoreductase subunit gamma